MTYNLKNLNVASLDYDNIINSLASFLEVQPGLTDIAFRDQASTANLLLRILSTATAYNGVYAQFGFTESFLSTSTLLESVLSIASNHSVTVPLTQSARALVTTNVAMEDYQAFPATTVDGSNTNFYLMNSTVGTTAAVERYLYAGSAIATYTNYDYDSQSMAIPYTVDPDTISFYVVPESGDKTLKTKWTRVSKGNQTETGNQNYFTVVNTATGYLVTNNFANAATVPSAESVIVRAITSNGTAGNNATIQDPNGYLLTIGIPSQGFNLITVDTAKAKLLFNATGYSRCVTLQDFKYAIIGSGIDGTDNEDNVSVRNGNIPGTVNIYVTDLSTSAQTQLIEYLNSRTVAGVQVVYAE